MKKLMSILLVIAIATMASMLHFDAACVRKVTAGAKIVLADSAYSIPNETEFFYRISELKNNYPDGGKWSGTYYENGIGKAWSCHGYACQMLYEVFGVQYYKDGFFNQIDYTMGTLYAGDLVRINSDNHTIFIIKVTNDRIYFTDANYDNKNGIRWDVSYTIEEMRDKFTYKMHLPNNTLSGNSSLESLSDPLDLGSSFYTTIENNNTGTALIGMFGNEVQSYALNSTLGQWWHFENCGNNEYRITNCYYGKCMDVYCGLSYNKTNVDLYDSNNSDAQRWYIKSSDSGYVLVPKCAPNLCVDIENTSTENGANVQIYSCSANNAQVFQLPYRLQSSPCDFGEHFDSAIIHSATGKAVANECGSLQLVNADDSYQQAWAFYRDKDCSYEIISYSQWGKCLDLNSGLPYNETSVGVYDGNATAAQRWFVVNEGENRYRLVPKCSTGRTLEVAGGYFGDGASFQIYDYNTSAAQYFSISTAAPAFKPLDYGEKFKAKITNVGTGKIVIGTNDDNVVVYTDNDADSAIWEFHKNTNGSYTVTNCEYNKNLDVYGGFQYEHTNIGLFKATGSTSQEWYLVKLGDHIAFVPSCAMMRAMNVKDMNSVNGTNVELLTYQETDSEMFTLSVIEDESILGDVDGDGEIEIRDATFIQRVEAKIDVPYYDPLAADVDGNGDINIMDATAIQYYLANMRTPFPIGTRIG